ncbi:MAG: T9SS type A sorting domain-containing protein [Melioribacteraceae bacterium]|nr:T9SS type A sorting domain-containing protein [Melioribacteraceae bacterium]
MKNLLIISLLFSSLLTLHSQTADPNNRKVGTLDGNNIKTVFSNWGVIGQWGDQGPRLAYKYENNGYIGDMSIVLGLQLPVKKYIRETNSVFDTLATENDTLHSVIVTPVARPGGGDYAPGGGSFWGFEPLSGFANSEINEIGKGVAMSHLPETWPEYWPDNPLLPNGVWNGLDGSPKIYGTQEAYFVLGDEKDEKMFERYNFLPTSENTLKGHGIEIAVRYMQFDLHELEDVLFRVYVIKNKSDYDYEEVVFGNLGGTYVGGEGDEWNDDYSIYDPKYEMVVVGDFEEKVRRSANPNWTGGTYNFSEKIIKSPDQIGMTSLDYFVPAGDITMSNEEDMWNRLRPHFFNYPSSVVWNQDSTYTVLRGEDGDYLWGSGYFELKSNSSDTIVSIITFGENAEELNQKNLIAETFWNNKFSSDSISSKNEIVNLSTNNLYPEFDLELETSDEITNYDIYYTPNFGNTWNLIAQSIDVNSSYHINSLDNSSIGLIRVFFRDKMNRVVSYSTTGQIYFDNPATNSEPKLRILNLPLDSVFADSPLELPIIVGDSDLDSLSLKVFYKNYDEYMNSNHSWYLLNEAKIHPTSTVQLLEIDLEEIPNSAFTRLKIELSDDFYTVIDTTDIFLKKSSRKVYDENQFNLEKWKSDATLVIYDHGISNDSFPQYNVTFDDTSQFGVKYYSCTGVKPYENPPITYYLVEKEPLFSGIESEVNGGFSIAIDDVETKYIDSLSYYPDSLRLSVFSSEVIGLIAYKNPSDYKIIFEDSLKYMSDTHKDIPLESAPINFRVINTRTNREIKRSAVVNPYNNQLGRILFIENINGEETPTWSVVFNKPLYSMTKSDTFLLSFQKGVSFQDTITIFPQLVSIEKSQSIKNYLLSNNYPNPFNPTTTIRFHLPEISKTKLELFDILGRRLEVFVDDELSAGWHTIKFNGSNYSSGVYFYKLTSGSFSDVKKMLLLK